ncbi:WYL domain-containing protein [Geosporobacter ferrireducens]|uniref:WYL domain-containing protein n=1 Tax=Geosporobacter ferrireducens TaxID=1424294 RepID=UPI00139B0F6E|nr:WYL domain-containing protein [Geosporobacter ferrireducens]MTI56526.1 WYL domain-containing protein [Geosporobacter ferrireducens]
MAGYTELIKNFEKIRSFTRDFFIYGFKGRGDFDGLSPRTYDNERRRIESYLSELIVKTHDSKGKSISISSNTIAKTSNPLFKVWQTKSFTKKDCFLHFVILDIFSKHTSLSVREVAEIISDDYTTAFSASEPMDTMTIRNKLKEYTQLGILEGKKSSKTLHYSLPPNPLHRLSPKTSESLNMALSYYKNILPGGFMGHSINNEQDSPFIYKQIYFSQTLDDEIVLKLLEAIEMKRMVTLTMIPAKGDRNRKNPCVPIQILSNTKSGRRYAAIYHENSRKFSTVRIDYIKDVDFGEICPEFDNLFRDYQLRMKHSFSITPQTKEKLHNLTVRLQIDEATEQYVLERIRREGQHGTLTKIEDNIFEYSIGIPDSLEMVPWLRTFIGRILQIEGSEAHILSQFKRDIHAMLAMYED